MPVFILSKFLPRRNPSQLQIISLIRRLAQNQAERNKINLKNAMLKIGEF